MLPGESNFNPNKVFWMSKGKKHLFWKSKLLNIAFLEKGFFQKVVLLKKLLFLKGISFEELALLKK